MSHYSFGTMSIGSDPGSIRSDIKLVRAAMDAEVWFHTCRRYACVDNFNVLGRALQECPEKIPGFICKIRCYNAETIRIDLEDTVRLLGLEAVDVAQLSKRSGEQKEIVDDFLHEGPMWEACCKAREDGLVRWLALELFVSCAEEGLTAVRHDMFDAYAFYYSVIDREVTNGLFRALQEKQAPVISIRTVGGGKIFPPVRERLRKEQPDHYYLRRLAALDPLFEKSGSRDWLDFAFRFLFGQENVPTTVGGTASADHLQEYLAAAASAEPLPDALIQEVHALQSQWLAEF